MTTDRLSSGYEPRFDIDYALGRQGEEYVQRVVDQFATGSIEVKTDAQAVKTGNVYIEHACRYDGEWRDSGIRVTTAELWAFVLGEASIYIVPTAILLRVHDWGMRMKFQRECVRGSHPTKGVTIPVVRLMTLCMQFAWDPDEDE